MGNCSIRSAFGGGGSRLAFTLAEVLITLGIIGVVAAMTLPTVTNKYRGHVLEQQFKKSYSNLSQVIIDMKKDLCIDGFKSKESSFKNWICAIAKYKAIDYKRKYISKLSEELDTETSYIDENLQKLEIEQEIEGLLQFLNDKDRELFKRYYLSGDKLEEIAFDNKTNVTNLHSRLSRGRKKIRKHILK